MTVTISPLLMLASTANSSFAAGAATKAGYRFNGWRLGYHYRLIDGPRGRRL